MLSGAVTVTVTVMVTVVTKNKETPSFSSVSSG
jgi:hypothetical protein